MKHENVVLSNELIKVELPQRKIWKTEVSSVSSWSERIGSDEGLALETSAFQIFHGGTSTFIHSFHKTRFLCGKK